MDIKENTLMEHRCYCNEEVTIVVTLVEVVENTVGGYALSQNYFVIQKSLQLLQSTRKKELSLFTKTDFKSSYESAKSYFEFLIRN